MGILVQRQFVVDTDDRQEFERQSREGLWPTFLRYGAQMVAFGAWAMGGPGDVVVTNTAYEDFRHWTATRPWGTFRSDPEMLEETRELRAISAGRARLIRQSRARVIVYDEELSGPVPRYRRPGEPLAPPPPTFGRRSVVEERTYPVSPGSRDELIAHCRAVWDWQKGQGARLIAAGEDPLLPPGNVVALVAHRTIDDWEHSWQDLRSSAPGPVRDAAVTRDRLAPAQEARLLMVATDFGNPV